MSAIPGHPPTPSERAVLSALAALGAATTLGVAIACRDVAHGTVRTRLQQLTRRGLVGRWEVALLTGPPSRPRRRWCAVYRLTAAGMGVLGVGPTGPTQEENTWADFAGIAGDD